MMSARIPFPPSRVPDGHRQYLFSWSLVDMEQNRGQKQGNIVAEGEQAGMMSARRDPDPSSQPDPFADLIDLSFVDMLKPMAPAAPPVAPLEPTSAPAPIRRDQTYPQDFSSRTRKAVTPPGREASVITVDPLATTENTLEAQKRKSQESRQKRDQFLDQMSSFLEGIESSTSSSGVDLIPLDPPASNREVHVPSKPPQTQAIAAEVGRVPGVEEVLWGTGTEEGTMMAANESIFPGPIMGDSFASRQITTVQPTSSLMLEDDQVEDPFARRVVPSRQQAKPSGVMRGVIIEDDKPHPRGSLFDDDIDDIPPEKGGDVEGAESGTQQPEKEGSFRFGDSVGPPPRRVTTSPASLSVPTYSKGRSVSQPRQGGKGKSTRGLDLEEVRRRTSLLSGGGELSAPPPTRTVTPARSAAPRLPEASPFYDADWRRLDAAKSPVPSSGEGPPHPLYASQANDNPLLSAAVSGGTFDERGNYFNEELLRVRGQAGAVSSSGSTALDDGSRGQGSRKGDALMDSAGNFFSSARDGAKTFLRDAKAGVDAVGNSWQKGRRENGRDHQRNGAGKSGRDNGREVEFEATFGEGRFGFTLYREQGNGPQKGKGVVCRVHPGSTAHTLGVQLGDTVSGINKRRYETYDEIMEVLPKLPRPVLISFTRGPTREGGAVLVAAAAAARQSSTTPSADQQQQGGGNPLEWLANLNPFDRQRRETQEELRGERRNSADASQDVQPWFPGEVFAQGTRGGVFSWSYYGTSDGVEANSRDTYTEHVMRCQWGRTVDTMQSWMVARRYREFDALDSDLRYAYPDRKDSLPRLPPKVFDWQEKKMCTFKDKEDINHFDEWLTDPGFHLSTPQEFFKMAPDVVERRTRGLEMYMTTIIRRFPDMLESSQLDRFLTISERISSMRNPPEMVSSSPSVMQRKLGVHGSSSNVFAMAEPSLSKDASGSSALVGTDYILDPMTSEKAYWLSRERKSDPIDVHVAENVIHQLEEHLSHLPPTAHLLSDAKLYELMERCQECWPRIKAAAAAALSAGNTETLLPRILQCDERMERAFESLKAALASRGYL